MPKALHPLLGDREWLKARIEAGRTWTEIMEDAGLTTETVSLVAYYVRKHGLQGTTINRKGKLAHPLLGNKQWLAAQLAAGRSYNDIAREAGVERSGSSLVAHYIKKHGLQTNLERSERMKAAYAKKYPNGRRGSEAANWQGGKMHMGNGYVMLYMPEHPSASPAGYVLEHRYVMEQKLGRLLSSREVVDHIDRNRSNNHPDNLRLHASRAEHVHDHFSARDQLVAALAALDKANTALNETKQIVRRFLDNHCANADAEGMSALCECRLCLDARQAVA